MTAKSWVLMLPGNRWEDVSGTDHQLALAIAENDEVLWVDPGYPFTTLLQTPSPRRSLHEVADGVYRLQPMIPPASSRPGVRGLASELWWRQIDGELDRRGVRPRATISLSPRVVLRPRREPTTLFVTDDWSAGAELMGLDQRWVRNTLRRNVRQANRVAAVTPDLARTIARLCERDDISVVPNGATVHHRPDGVTRTQRVGLVGQLNERLDLTLLEAVADRGVPVTVVGPLSAKDEQVEARFRRWVDRPNVTWRGRVDLAELAQYLFSVSVGITPYADTAFNRASFPLKTLEYLAAGAAVVATDLPASRWLDSPDIAVTSDPQSFADHVVRLLEQPLASEDERRRMAFAQRHSWSARAADLLSM